VKNLLDTVSSLNKTYLEQWVGRLDLEDTHPELSLRWTKKGDVHKIISFIWAEEIMHSKKLSPKPVKMGVGIRHIDFSLFNQRPAD